MGSFRAGFSPWSAHINVMEAANPEIQGLRSNLTDDGPAAATLCLTYRYKLLPKRNQYEALERLLEDQRQLYNAALEERISAWRLARKSITRFDQMKSLAIWRGFDEEAASVPSNLQRWTIVHVDRAFAGFFQRVKTRNGRAGFPRFRSRSRWRSFGFSEFSGIRLTGNRLRFKGMPGGLRLHLHRQMPSATKVLSCVFRKDPEGWHVSLQVKVAKAPRRSLSRGVGIDPGLETLLTLSDGTVHENLRPLRKLQSSIRCRSRALARCKRGSNRRKKIRRCLARLHLKARNARSTHLHQVSASIVQTYDFIALEDTNVKGLSRGMLAGSFSDAAHSILRSHLRYKAERAGALLVMVDPRNTSQICSGCDAHVPKELSERVHRCPGCGLRMSRDMNAARTILARAVVGPGLVNVAHQGKRRAGKISEKITA